MKVKQCMDSENLHRRLKKIIGQVQAIDRMIDEDIPCEDILSQLNAAKSALHKCGRSFWKDISSTASATGSSMEMQIKRLRALPRLWNGFPIWDRKGCKPFSDGLPAFLHGAKESYVLTYLYPLWYNFCKHIRGTR